MQDPQILSTPDAPAQSAPSSSPTTHSARSEAETVLVFDACHLGVVLRAVLVAELVLALAALYYSHDALDWLLHLAWLTSGGLSGTLLWLVLACSLKRWLQRMATWQQFACGIGLGMLCGLYASAMLALTGTLAQMHWLANTLVGGLLATVLVGWLLLRARGRVPAATTAQLAMLQASIRPHFLFNTLNSAIALVREEPGKAERLLEDLSDLFRAALQDPRTTIPLSEEIDLARRYLDIEQIRFGSRLQVEWKLDESIMDVGLPPLLLQPLVENAVKHGVEPSEFGAKVTICSKRLSPRFILLSVVNTLALPQFASPRTTIRQGNGMALENVKSRLRLLHDVQTEFSAVAHDGVFEVRITLPTR